MKTGKSGLFLSLLTHKKCELPEIRIIFRPLRKVPNVKMHIKQMIKIVSTVTVLIVTNLGIKPVNAKQ